MPRENLTSEKQYTEEESNVVVGQITPLYTWNVPDGQEFRLSEGEPIVADFETTQGNNPSRGTTLGLMITEPDDPLGGQHGQVFAEFPILPFNELSIAEQQSGENSEVRRLDFIPKVTGGNGEVVAEDVDEIQLVALSPPFDDPIDPSSSYISYPMEVE